LRGTPEHLLPASSSPYMHTDQELHPANTPACTSAVTHGAWEHQASCQPTQPNWPTVRLTQLAHKDRTTQQHQRLQEQVADMLCTRPVTTSILKPASCHSDCCRATQSTSTISTCQLLAEGNTATVVQHKSSTPRAADVHRSTCKQSQRVTKQQVHKLHSTGNTVGCYSVDKSHEQQDRTMGCHCCWKIMHIVHAAAGRV
jgi:hypothetical protein